MEKTDPRFCFFCQLVPGSIVLENSRNLACAQCWLEREKRTKPMNQPAKERIR